LEGRPDQNDDGQRKEDTIWIDVMNKANERIIMSMQPALSDALSSRFTDVPQIECSFLLYSHLAFTSDLYRTSMVLLLL